MILRQFIENDRAEVIALWTLCGLTRPQNNPSRDIDRKINENPRYIFIAECDAKIVGTIMVGYDGHRGWLNYLAVHPEYRRRGIATKMIDEAKRALMELGCPKINLQVRSSNINAKMFYKSIGFVEDDVVSFGMRLTYEEETYDVQDKP